MTAIFLPGLMHQGLSFPHPFSHITVDTIVAAVPWINRDAPRDECFMSTKTDSYTYGRDRGVRTYEPIPYTARIEEIRKQVSEIVGVDYEACFLNKYDDERKHLGWHADDSPSIDHTAGIAVVSFGAEREIWFRKMGWFDNNQNQDPAMMEAALIASMERDKAIERVLMPHGSLMLMPAGFQQTHQHRIPKHGAKCGVRVSLTFRKLVKS